MGTKIPFRFPMVDTLVPTVQMFDVSRLVSAPIEARAISGFPIVSTAANRALILDLQSLSTGGLFVEFLALDVTIALPENDARGRWAMVIQEALGVPAPTTRTKVDVGGVPTRSLFAVDVAAWNGGFAASAALLPPTITFQPSPRVFVPPGQRMVIQSPRGQNGDEFGCAISWAELPASFEQA